METGGTVRVVILVLLVYITGCISGLVVSRDETVVFSELCEIYKDECKGPLEGCNADCILRAASQK